MLYPAWRYRGGRGRNVLRKDIPRSFLIFLFFELVQESERVQIGSIFPFVVEPPLKSMLSVALEF